MGRVVLLFVFVAGSSLTAGSAWGQIMFSLDSPDDLSKLAVGQTVRFDVMLSGITAGQRLDWAQARVLYPASRMGVASVMPGSIVPATLNDPLDFQSIPDSGKVEAVFMTLGTSPAHHLTSNGALFSFEVEVLTPGHGTVEFDLLDTNAEFVTENTGTGPLGVLPISMSGALPFYVVPEPSAIALGFASAATLAWFFRVNAKRKLQNAKCG
jgi:hypothetical protein